MSYENPTRAIDTQTGQHLANLQNTISSTFQGVAKTYKAEQEARTKKLNEQAEIITNIKKSNQALEDNLRNKMSEFGAQNPSLNADAWLATVDRVNDIKNTIDLGTASPKEIAALRQELSEIMALPTLGRTMLENLTQSVVDFDKVLNNAGKMGGADLYSGSTMIEDLRVWQNLSPGERKQVIQKNPKNGKWEASIVINGNQYTSDQLSRLTANGEGLIAIVSDQTSNFDNYTNMVKPKDEKTGEDKFNEGILSPIKHRNTEDGNAESYRVVNKEVVKKIAGIEIDASISVMTASEKAVFWNNMLAKKGSGNRIIVNPEDPRARSMSSEDFDDPKNEELFKKAYTDKWIDSRIGAEVILSSKRIETKELTPAQQTAAQNKNKINEEAYSSVVAMITDTSSFLVGRKFSGSGEISKAIITPEGVLDIQYYTGSKYRDKDTKSLKRDWTERSYDITNPNETSILAEKLYPGKGNEKRREAFENQINLRYGEGKTGIGEKKEGVVPKTFANNYVTGKGKYD